MPAFRWNCLLLCLFLSPSFACHFKLSLAQEVSDEESAEERKQLEAVARFMTVLEKNPRRGTAFDRVYGHHVEYGTLDRLVTDLTARASAAGAKGEVAMILGMIEYQRGNDAGAVGAFSKAESIRTTDPLPCYYLGQAQIRLGDSTAAVTSFERALDRKPQRADQLEIFQQLGRLHQRAQRTEEAMKVWKRLEELYPADPRVLEQIALTLNEEGQFSEALPRYEKLASTSKDDYRKTTFAITAAELVVKQGDKSGGIKRMEKLLAELNPDGWLYRDVRRRIDDCFLRTGDQDGLVAYYQSWLEVNPKDVEAMNRLARFLKQSARNPEAAAWLDKALALAPKRADIRKTYIDLLAEDKRFEEAANQFEQLLSAAPGNADYLRDWGKMILRNKELPELDRRKKALSVWNRIIETNPKDAVLVSQVADLCRQNQMSEEAESLYRRSIDLAPTEPQYREYLGEFLHIQKRVDEAKMVWQEIAAGDRRNETNLARLAEIYNSFGFGDEACDKIAESIELSPKDFALVLKGAEYHNKAARFEGAMKLADQAEKLVANEDERESVLNTRINVLQSSQQLDAESEKLEQQFLANENTTAEDWYRLARYRESQRQWEDATLAINRAIEKAPESVLSITAAARIAESAGEFGRAADLFRKLTQVDRRSISDHWTSVTRLETQMGRKEQALEAAKQLIVAGPSKTENYEFYAQTCFRLGEADEGMQALRKAIRINPNEPSLMMTLGAALADQMRTDEAIELYWRAYEKSDEVSDKSTMVTKLVPLYSQINQIDKLFERLQRERQEEDERRSATICIAQAWQTAGDISEARKELEGLLGENTKDTNLLNQLAKLCQDDADIDSAINYQRQLVSIAPGDETETPLAGMLLRVGEVEEAREIYARLIAAEEDPVRQMRSLDALLNSGNFDTALRVMEPMLEKQRDDWELLYRYGVCWQGLGNDEEARARFKQIIALPIAHESLGRSAAAKLKQAQEKARSDNLKGITTVIPSTQSPLQMSAQSAVVRAAVGFVNEDYYGGNTQPLWIPESYGLARMAALGWMMRFDEDAETAKPSSDQNAEATDVKPTMAEAIRDAGLVEDASNRARLDGLFVSLLKGDNPSAFAVARKLAIEGDIEEKRYFLQSLRTREISADSENSYNENGKTSRTPLSEADLELMQRCFDAVNAKTKDQSLEAIYGSNIAYGSNGQAYVLVGSSYQMLPGVFQNSSRFLNILLEEYRYAGKTERMEDLIKKQLQSAESASEWMAVLNTLRQEEKTNQIPDALDKWVEAAIKEIAERPIVATQTRNSASKPLPLATSINFLQQWIGQLGSDEENDRILVLFDKIMPVAEAESRYREKRLAASRVSTAGMANANQSNAVFNIQTYYGKTPTRVQISFPPLSTELDATAIMALRQFYDVLKKNDVDQDLAKKIRSKSEGADQGSAFWKWCLASVQWWSDEQDEAMKIATQLMSENASNPDMQFRLAALLESRNEFEDALAITNSITARDQSRLIRRETLALRLAERIGDSARAKLAAERLFGLRLTTEMQTQLIPQLRRLGMDAQAEAIMSRMERSASRQPATLLTLMTLYQSQGKTENANQAAMAILRKTTSPYSASRNSSGVSSMNVRTPDSSQRTAAIQQLSRSGAMKKLVEQLKEKLERTPDSVYTLEQLIEYTLNANQSKEAEEYLNKAITLRPESHVLRWNLASILNNKGKYKEACDQYLLIFDLQPNWIMEQGYEVQQAFSQAKRQKELIAKFESMDLKRIRNPWGLINMIQNNLNQDPANANNMIGLIERIHAAYPSYRSQIISTLINNSELLKNDRAFDLVKRSVMASAKSRSRAGAWAGLDDVISYSSDGIDVAFSNLLKMSDASSTRSVELRKSIEQQVEQNSTWLGGQAMLGLLDLAGKNREEGLKRIEKLLENEADWKDIPYETCWYLGQRLGEYKETEQLAIRLLKEADKRQGQGGVNGLEYAPISNLARLVGNKLEERAYIKERIDERDRQQSIQMASYSDPDYEAYQRIQRVMSLGKLYMTIGYPIDSYITIKSIENDTSLGSASRFYGNTDYLKSQIQEISDSASKALTDQALSDSLERLLPSDKPIDLMVSSVKSKTAKERSIPKMKSSLLDILKLTATKAESRELISKRLGDLVKAKPADLNTGIIHALWQMEQEANSDALALSLKSLVNMAKLEPIAEGRRPNSRQRQEAKTTMHLWLVAREILTKNTAPVTEDEENESQDSAQKAKSPVRLRSYTQSEECRQLAFDAVELAIEAGTRQLSRAQQCEVLVELAALQTAQKELDLAEKNWARLLDLATRKLSQSSLVVKSGEAASNNAMRPSVSPSGKSPTDESSSVTATGKGDGATNTIPPLTISQFRVVMTVHDLAAESGRMDIAARALGISLRGGLPVSDPDMKVENPGRATQIVMGGTQKPPEDPIESEVQNTIRESIGYWSSATDIPVELFDALKLSILPSTRPDEVRLYVNASSVEAGREDSLATTLVRIASQAGKLDALRREVEIRNAKATSLLSKRVLLTLIAIEAGDLEKSSQLISELNREAEKLTSPQSFQILGIAALRAFSIPELKKESIPVLKRLISIQLNKSSSDQNDLFSEQQTGRFWVSDLMTQLNKHLMEIGDEKSVRENYESALQSRTSAYARYSDSGYLQYLQRNDLANLAKSTAQLGLLDYTAELLGRYADTPFDGRYGYTPANQLGTTMEYLLRVRRNEPPIERYRAWFEWTMPTEQRITMRILTAQIRPVRIPDIIARSKGRTNSLANMTLEPGVYSNLSELVLAAAEADQLDTLEKELTKFTEEESRAKKVIQELITIQRKDVAEVSKLVASRVEESLELAKRSIDDPGYTTMTSMVDENSIVGNFCRKLGFEAEARKLLKQSESIARDSDISLQSDEAWSYQTEPIVDYENFRGNGRPDTAELIVGWLRYPLTGDFTISWDSSQLGSALEFGGLRWDTLSNNIRDSSGLVAPVAILASKAKGQRYEIRVKGDQLGLYVNGLQVVKDRTWGTSPWFALASVSTRSQWNRLRIEGDVRIPSEVPLISKESMDGWNASAFQESISRARSTPEREAIMLQTRRTDDEQLNEEENITWSVENGTLKAKPLPRMGLVPQESWLRYQRPLDEQDSVRYQFFAKQDEIVAHPTLGNVAMVIRADGLSLHYLDPMNSARVVYNLDSESMVNVESDAFKSGTSPLKDNEWNDCVVTVREGKADLTLNGTLLYSLPLDSGIGTQFGFFRYKHQKCEIRNIVLSGAWPSSIKESDVSDWNSKNKAYWQKLPVDDSQPRISDPISPDFWDSIVRNGDEASVSEMLELVLPSQGKYPRFSFSLVERDNLANGVRETVELNCVAIELMKLAIKYQQVDRVKLALEDFRSKYPESERFLGALNCLLLIEGGDDSASRKALEQYLEVIVKDDLDLPRHLHQTADFVVAARASSVPGLRDLSMKILDRIQELDREQRTRTQDPSLIKWSKRLVGDLQILADQATVAQSINPSPQWTPLDFGNQRHGTYESTANQFSTWFVNRGKAVHYGSDLASPMIFQSPLTGKFEVVADRTTWDRQEVSIMYSMHAAEPKYDLSAVSVTNHISMFDRGSKMEIPEFLDKSRARFRILIDDDTITTYTNDVEIYEHSTLESSAPWLMLEAVYPDFRCEVENLRIIGSPKIPEELVLTSSTGVEAWDGSLFGNSISKNENDGGNWRFSNNEVNGFSYYSDPYRENYIRYLRPMLEDGIVEYDFWYDDDSEVHPAIGGQALLVKKDGLFLHQITLLNQDKSDLLSNNAVPLDPPSKPIDLKSEDWNRIRLELKGDNLSVVVNDVSIGSVLVKDPARLRHIGMLHFGGKQARFRNMKYRGEWPKTLPPVEEQILAKP